MIGNSSYIPLAQQPTIVFSLRDAFYPKPQICSRTKDYVLAQ